LNIKALIEKPYQAQEKCRLDLALGWQNSGLVSVSNKQHELPQTISTIGTIRATNVVANLKMQITIP
jgi:hypothetical protein